MKAYILYLLKTKWLQTLVLAIIPSVISISIIGLSRSFSYVNPNAHLQDPIVMLTPVVIMNIMLFIVPILRLSPLKNVREVDLYYALPMKQSKLYLSHLIFGFLQVIIIWTTLFFLSELVFLLVYARLYQTLWFLPIYIVGILYISMIYALTGFLFMRANQIIDGIAFILLTHLVLVLIPTTSVLFGYQIFGDFLPFLINPFSGFSNWSMTFISLSNPHSNHGFVPLLFDDSRRFIGIVMHTVLYMALTVCSLRHTIKHMDHAPVEKIGSISDSLFGYRVLIPLVLYLATSLVMNFGISSGLPFIFIVILTSFALIGYFIYRRSVKIKLNDVIWIIISLFFGILIGLIF